MSLDETGRAPIRKHSKDIWHKRLITSCQLWVPDFYIKYFFLSKRYCTMWVLSLLWDIHLSEGAQTSGYLPESDTGLILWWRLTPCGCLDLVSEGPTRACEEGALSTLSSAYYMKHEALFLHGLFYLISVDIHSTEHFNSMYLLLFLQLYGLFFEMFIYSFCALWSFLSMIYKWFDIT